MRAATQPDYSGWRTLCESGLPNKPTIVEAWRGHSRSLEFYVEHNQEREVHFMLSIGHGLGIPGALQAGYLNLVTSA